MLHGKLGQRLLYGSLVGVIAAATLLSAACSSTAATSTTAAATAAAQAASGNTDRSNTQPARTQSAADAAEAGMPDGEFSMNDQETSFQPGEQGGFRGMGNMGTLTAIDGSTLTLESAQGDQISVVYTSDTTFQKTAVADIADLAVDDEVMVTGTLEEDGTLTATSISTGSQLNQFSAGMGGPGNRGNMPGGNMPGGGMADGEMPSGEMPTGDMPSGEMPADGMPDGQMAGGPSGEGGFPGDFNSGWSMISGTIVSTDTDSIVVQTSEGEEITVNVSADTSILQTQSVDSSDLQTGDYLVVRGESDENGTVTATSISILPEGLQMQLQPQMEPPAEATE